jgi:hypothetical protein
MNPVRLVVTIFTALVFFGFSTITIREVNLALSQVSKILSECVPSKAPEKPVPCKFTYSSFSETIISTVGATLTTLVAGFLGIAGVKWGQDKSGYKNLAEIGGGNSFVGWALAIGSFIFALSLLYATYGSYSIANSAILYKQLEIIPPPILGQMSATGIGLVLGGLGAFVGSRIK